MGFMRIVDLTSAVVIGIVLIAPFRASVSRTASFQHPLPEHQIAAAGDTAGICPMLPDSVEPSAGPAANSPGVVRVSDRVVLPASLFDHARRQMSVESAVEEYDSQLTLKLTGEQKRQLIAFLKTF